MSKHKHKHDKHCDHQPPVEPPVEPPVKPPVIEIPVPPPQEIHQVPIEGAAPILIPLLVIAAWVAVRSRGR